MNKFDYYTKAHHGGDFENKYAKILSIPLPLLHANNYAGDIHLVFEVFWLSNYHRARYGKYSVCVRQDLSSVLLTYLGEMNETLMANGVGYLITNQSIDIYAKCGANGYPVQFNVLGSSRKNIYVEPLILENFVDVSTLNGIKFCDNANQNSPSNRIFNYLKTVKQPPTYTTFGGSSTECYCYQATKDIILNLKLKLKFYSNQNSGNCLVQLTTTTEGELYRKTVSLSSSGDVVDNIDQILTLPSGSCVYVYVQQYTGSNVNMEVIAHHNG